MTRDEFRVWLMTATEEDFDAEVRQLNREQQRFYRKLLRLNGPALIHAAQALLSLEDAQTWQLLCVLWAAVRNSGPYLRGIHVHLFLQAVDAVAASVPHAD